MRSRLHNHPKSKNFYVEESDFLWNCAFFNELWPRHSVFHRLFKDQVTTVFSSGFTRPPPQASYLKSGSLLENRRAWKPWQFVPLKPSGFRPCSKEVSQSLSKVAWFPSQSKKLAKLNSPDGFCSCAMAPSLEAALTAISMLPVQEDPCQKTGESATWAGLETSGVRQVLGVPAQKKKKKSFGNHILVPKLFLELLKCPVEDSIQGNFHCPW